MTTSDTTLQRPPRSTVFDRPLLDRAAERMRELRQDLRNAYAGLEDDDLGHLTDWVLATLIARENVLLLGPPGVAKSEIATRTFKQLGLSSPQPSRDLGETLDRTDTSPWEWWQEREKEERQTERYFHYLLSRFTQPEELFGPIEISLLRRGVLARINFGLLTGPGVRAAFLDEVFKASSSILNTLLTLTQERLYFNWGGMVPSDLICFIGASNEMPGGLGTGTVGVGSAGEDFETLYAFVDRFPVRLAIPVASGTSAPGDVAETDLGRAFQIAMERQADAFLTPDPLAASRPSHMPSIQDILLLGQACLWHKMPARDGRSRAEIGHVFHPQQLRDFEKAFLEMARSLQQDATDLNRSHLSWTITPRKLKALYKVALAHALVRDTSFGSKSPVVKCLGAEDLWIYSLIWDTPSQRLDLKERTRSLIEDVGSALCHE